LKIKFVNGAKAGVILNQGKKYTCQEANEETTKDGAANFPIGSQSGLHEHKTQLEERLKKSLR
jgi:hypothetical protein